MLPRDLVYVGHMLDMARKAVAKVRDLIVLAAVYHDLSRQATAFGEAKPAIERLRLSVGSPDLDYKLLIPGFACEGLGCFPQLASDTSAAPLR